MNTIEGNKLIAEFMGAKVLDNNTCKPYPNELPHWAKRLYDFDTLRIGGYEYHTSFDWLMPVVERINTILNECGKKTMRHEWDDGEDKNLDDPTGWRSWSYRHVHLTTDISRVFAKVIEAIQWYNKEKGVQERDASKDDSSTGVGSKKE